MALVFVLWIVVLLTAIAFQMAYRGHLRARITATTGDTAQAFFLARSGIEMAISDLVVHAKSAADQAALRDESERLYKNVELGRGAYTLFAGMDGGVPTYGFADECAKININTADAEMLGRLSTLRTGVAEAIIALREEEENFRDLSALQLIEGVDLLDIYGEDQNGNGLLDSNEDDGDQSWPPDDGDGTLDGGMAQYLTVWSAARDVDTNGESRVNLSEAGAEVLMAALPDLTQQQADSIVYHRNENAFSSIIDLLQVELVEKVEQGGDGEGQGDNGPPQGNPNAGQSSSLQESPSQNGDATGQSGQDSENGEETETAANGQQRPEDGPKGESEGEEKKEEEQNQSNYKKTGKKAFEQDVFRKYADLVTVSDDEILRGRINVNTAPLEVLACLPEIDESIAQAIINERLNRLDGFGTALDLLDVRGIDDNRLKGILNLICVRSDVFSVRSFGVLRDGRTFASATAVLDRTDDTVRVLQWRDHG